MFKNGNTQYVNIKRYDKQFKIDSQILKNSKINKTEHSSFLIENKLPNDAISKLNILQKNINKTYLTTLCESLNQKIVKVDEFSDENYEIKRLNSDFNIAILKKDLLTQKKYFQQTGIDYILSPFTILYHHLMLNENNKNSLNILTLNNTIYALILDDNNKIIYSTIKTLTAFDDIQDSEFYKDGLDKQKLFDEMNLLEIQEAITSITNDFYETSEDKIFCENVSIFYTIKQLGNQQLNNLQETLMLDIKYTAFSLDEYLFNLSQQIDASKISFIAIREKNKASFFAWFIYMILSITLTGAILFYMQNQEKVNQFIFQKDKKIEIKKQIKIAKIKLPNHRIKNEKITNLILSVFDIVPYNAVLNELQLQKNDSIFVCNFLDKDTFTKDIQPKLLKVYKASEILLIQDNKPVFNAIIANSNLIPQKLTTKPIQPNYKRNKFVTKDKLIKQLEAFLPKDSQILFKSKFKSKTLTYNFNIATTLKTPKDFFNFAEELNKKSYSINIAYPIEFAQTKKGLETNFNLQFHQFYKK